LMTPMRPSTLSMPTAPLLRQFLLPLPPVSAWLTVPGPSLALWEADLGVEVGGGGTMVARGSNVTFLASASALALAISFAAFLALAAEPRTAVAVLAVATLMMAACSGVMDTVAGAALTCCRC
jgi:hypothetical protein